MICTLILWDVATKQPIGRLMGHTNTVRALAFSTDNDRLFSGSWDGETRVWELNPKVLQRICRERAGRNLTQKEWPAYFPDEKYRETWDLRDPPPPAK